MPLVFSSTTCFNGLLLCSLFHTLLCSSTYVCVHTHCSSLSPPPPSRYIGTFPPLSLPFLLHPLLGVDKGFLLPLSTPLLLHQTSSFTSQTKKRRRKWKPIWYCQPEKEGGGGIREGGGMGTPYTVGRTYIKFLTSLHPPQYTSTYTYTNKSFTNVVDSCVQKKSIPYLVCIKRVLELL